MKARWASGLFATALFVAGCAGPKPDAAPPERIVTPALPAVTAAAPETPVPVAKSSSPVPASGSSTRAPPAPAATARVAPAAAEPNPAAPANAPRPAPKSSAAPAQTAPPAAAVAKPAETLPPPAPFAAPTPTLDLKSLEQRLRETRAIGVFTKLALKNQVDDLLDKFRDHHAGKPKPPLSELRQRFDGLMMKVLALLQDGDPSLARTIVTSRDALWGILADPVKFTKI
jgi:hypothetical protein